MIVKTCGLKNYSDKHFTNKILAKSIVEYFSPTIPCLEPFAGDGAFLEYLPIGSDWCEIDKGRDFSNYNSTVEWIIRNPPFEELTKWMEKSFSKF